MQRELYALSDREKSAAIRITPNEATAYNQKGFGIFWTVNSFGGERRIKQNLKRINSWYVDLDSGEKHQMLERIDEGLIPSLVVETKRGYHVYFDADDHATVSTYEVIQSRLIEYYAGDKRAKDLCRILRAPGYYHMKEEPFEVQAVWRYPVKYSAQKMLYFYPPTLDELPKEVKAIAKQKVQGSDLFERLFNLDQSQALLRLSGTPSVNCEVYSFRPTGAGKSMILVNQKPTSCWIDRNKRIGSTDKGGPTVWQWLRWFGHSQKETYQIVKHFLPELFT